MGMISNYCPGMSFSDVFCLDSPPQNSIGKVFIVELIKEYFLKAFKHLPSYIRKLNSELGNTGVARF